MSLDTFEQSLLDELRQHVAARTATQPAPHRRWTARWQWPDLPPLPPSPSPSASARVLSPPAGRTPWSHEPDGDVVVTVHDLTDASGLEHALAAKGVHADVTYVPGFSQSAGQSGHPPAETRLHHHAREGRRRAALHPRCRADRRRVAARHRHERLQPQRTSAPRSRSSGPGGAC